MMVVQIQRYKILIKIQNLAEREELSRVPPFPFITLCLKLVLSFQRKVLFIRGLKILSVVA